MSISSTTCRNDNVGNGAVSVYSYTFKLFQAIDLLVAIADLAGEETVLELGVDYSVSGIGTRNGGNVTLISDGQSWLTGGNLKNGYKIVFLRSPALLQQTSIKNNGEYFADLHENTFDTLLMQIQELQDTISRSAQFGLFAVNSIFNPVFPNSYYDIANANGILTLNANANGFDIGPSVAEVSSDAAASAAAAAAAAESEAAAAEAEAAATAAQTSASASATSATDSATAATASETAAAASAAAAIAAAAALYNATVGIAGNYATLALALAAASAGWKICVLDSATIAAEITVSLNDVQIDFNPGVTYTSGVGFVNPCIDINATGVRINGGRFLNFTTAIQIENGKNFNFIKACRFNNCTTQIDDLNAAPNNVYGLDFITEA
jgi:hypothetical protein